MLLWSWSINILWSWTINDLKNFFRNFLKCTCSRSTLQHAPGACAFKYGPGAFDLENYFRLLMVQDHIILANINGPGPYNINDSIPQHVADLSCGYLQCIAELKGRFAGRFALFQTQYLEIIS